KQIGRKLFALIRRLARRKQRHRKRSRLKGGQPRNKRASPGLRLRRAANWRREIANTKSDLALSLSSAPPGSLLRKCWQSLTGAYKMTRKPNCARRRKNSIRSRDCDWRSCWIETQGPQAKI